MTEDAFEAIKAFVERELDFATSHYNDSYLRRRFDSRIRRRGVENDEQYHELLRSTPDEHEELLNALSINVTGFFRNPTVWSGIAELLRQLTDTNDHVRVWSAGCADGREPYSVVMLALDDPRIDADRVQVLATDINESALDAARDGIYQRTHTVDLESELSFLDEYRPYVERDGSRFQVRDSVRNAVTFKRHDLINDGPFRGCDLVICRNLFIYIDTEYKEPIVETLTASLRRERYLVIGKAETLPRGTRDKYDVVESDSRIYRKR